MAKKLKRAVIKEELVALTGDYLKAVLLNQFLYWSERTEDIDAYLAEEKARSDGKLDVPFTHGWIYKSADQLCEETMLGLNRSTILRHIQTLIDHGWLHVRQNPAKGWDRTKQYRPDLLQIQRDLAVLGYALQGYHFDETERAVLHNTTPPVAQRNTLLQDATPPVANCNSKLHSATAIPEITPEIQNTETIPENAVETLFLEDIDKAECTSLRAGAKKSAPTKAKAAPADIPVELEPESPAKVSEPTPIFRLYTAWQEAWGHLYRVYPKLEGRLAGQIKACLTAARQAMGEEGLVWLEAALAQTPGLKDYQRQEGDPFRVFSSSLVALACRLKSQGPAKPDHLKTLADRLEDVDREMPAHVKALWQEHERKTRYDRIAV